MTDTTEVRFFRHGNKTVSLSGLRCIEEIRSNPCGGAPYQDGGILYYEDGAKFVVGLEFAQALAAFVATRP